MYKKIIGSILLLSLIWLALPSNQYVRQALIHLHPKIDQYPIFENRIVEAGSPKAWKFAETYNTKAIPENYVSTFEALGTVAYLIIQDTTIVFEQYWEDYSPTSHSNSFSMAKSVVSLAVGCALDEGLIGSVEQPVSDFFPEFQGYQGKKLTIHHLLTMSAGFDFDEAYSSLFSPTTKLYYGNDLVKMTLDVKEKEEPGGYYDYQSIVTQLLALIVEKVTGENISNYVSRKIWTPVRAEEHALWSLDKKEGIEKAYCCFNSNARDFARLGQLILNRGEWEGTQIISTSYLEKALQPDTLLIDKEYGGANHAYGYQFWQLTYKGMQVNYLRGILGQYVLAIPEKNMVVVRLGHKRSETRTTQHYPDDIDVWLAAALEMVD